MISFYLYLLKTIGSESSDQLLLFAHNLHTRVSAGHLDVVCLLVSQGAEISCKDKRGYIPLHTAASSGQIAVVKHLLNLAVEVGAHTHTHT